MTKVIYGNNNFSNNSWSELISHTDGVGFVSTRQFPFSFIYNNEVYVFGGYNRTSGNMWKTNIQPPHTFSDLTNVRIVYTRHSTANRNLLYTDNTAIESFDVLLDNTLSAANRNKAIEVTYTKHGTANRNIANASGAAVASFSNNNDNTAAPTLSSMTLGDEGSRMGGWRKLDYTGGVKITELANVAGGSVCTFDKKNNTISMNGSTSGTFGAFLSN